VSGDDASDQHNSRADLDEESNAIAKTQNDRGHLAAFISLVCA
jgi:hypothetical protein